MSSKQARAMLANCRKTFRNRDYVRLWTGQTAAAFGDAVYQVAFGWLVYKTSSSAAVAGVVLFCASAPYLLFGLLGGVYADRLNRRHVMIVGDLVRGIAVAVVPIMALFSALSLPVVAVVAFVLACARCFFYPASKSAVADILTDDAERQAGSAFLQASFQTASVAGVALGGIMINLCSAALIYFTPVVCYAISIIFLLQITSIPDEPATESDAGVIAEIVETLIYVRTMPHLFWAIMLFGLGVLVVAGLDQIALPALSDGKWQVGPSGLGFMFGALEIGNVVGSLVMGEFKSTRLALVMFGGWALLGLAIAFIGASPVFVLALAFAFVAGFAEAMNDIPMVLLIQSSVPRDRMGKVFSMWSTVVFSAEAGSSLVAGLVIGSLGASLACCAAGAGLVLIAAFGLLMMRPAPTMTPAAQVAYA